MTTTSRKGWIVIDKDGKPQIRTFDNYSAEMARAKMELKVHMPWAMLLEAGYTIRECEIEIRFKK